MTAIRRVATVLGQPLAVRAGASVSASADFQESVATAHAVGSLTVAPPAWLSINDSRATTTNGNYYASSTAAGWGPNETTTTTTSQTVDAGNLSLQPRLSVTTLTSYGWTAQSSISRFISC